MSDETQPSADALAQDFKKDELKTAAAVQGVEVGSKDTKADIAEKLVSAGTQVQVTNRTRRSGDDALLGSWVDVVDGEHEGRRGHYFEDVSYGADGYPQRVHVRTRDADNIIIEADYSHIRPAPYSGGR